MERREAFKDFRLPAKTPEPSFFLMSIEKLEDQVLQLPRDERRRFARWFYEHENQIVEPREGDEISVATKAEILRRSAELDANPGLAVPVTGEWFEQLKRRLADGTGQASAR